MDRIEHNICVTLFVALLTYMAFNLVAEFPYVIVLVVLVVPGLYLIGAVATVVFFKPTDIGFALVCFFLWFYVLYIFLTYYPKHFPEEKVCN